MARKLLWLHHQRRPKLPEKKLADQAAQWGADQELDACCEWLTTTAMTKPGKQLLGQF